MERTKVAFSDEAFIQTFCAVTNTCSFHRDEIPFMLLYNMK